MFDRKGYTRKYFRRYYIKDKEEISKRHIQWQKDNFKKVKEYNKERYIENIEKISKQHKEWAKTGQGKITKQKDNIKRRTIGKEITNNLTVQEWLDILEKYDYKCAYCDVEFDCENLPTKDHVTPVSKGGHNTREDVVPACRSCNSKKHNNILEEKVFQGV